MALLSNELWLEVTLGHLLALSFISEGLPSQLFLLLYRHGSFVRRELCLISRLCLVVGVVLGVSLRLKCVLSELLMNVLYLRWF